MSGSDLIGCIETFAGICLELWGVLEWYKCIGDDVSNKAVEIDIEFEVDVGDWGTQWPEDPIVPD